MKISIIVPVYNMERYLPECIESIIGQTYADIEIILVDDGSTDRSGKICYEYMQRDSRIKTLHQANQGRVRARAKGLEYASGKYVLFVDSDDWVEKNMCAELIHLAEHYDTDLVTFGYICEGGQESGTRKTDAFREGLYQSPRDLKELLFNSMVYQGKDVAGFIFSLWTKLYRSDIAMQVMKMLPDILSYGEDYTFNNIYLTKCKSVYVSSHTYYHYRFHEDSTVNSPCVDFMQQIGVSQTTLRSELLKMEDSDILLNNLSKRTFFNFVRMWNTEMKEESEIHIPIYCFDYSKLQADKVVLYGAGKVGIDYYLQFSKTAPSKLVLWVDNNYENIRNEQYDVCSVESIATTVYDKIFIAVGSEQVAHEIQKELMERFHISEERISWQKPKHYWE